MTALAAGTSLGNLFAYDDIPMVLENTRVHSGSALGTYLGQPYWPSGNGLAYRPVTVWLFSIQWSLGGGSPTLYHLVSLALYGSSVLVLFRLGCQMMPPWAAWVAAALFAVHPVHVEAVANIVGQAELLTGLATLVAVLWYLKGRQNDQLTSARRLALAGITLVAALAKEQGLLVPLALLLAEATVVNRTRPLVSRLRLTASLWFTLAATVAAVLLLRRAVLGGLAGGMQAIALSGASTGQRLLTMLGVVPHWARLLLWPGHLQADYSPPAFDRSLAFGAPQLMGAALVLLVATVIWRTWSRRPAIAFGAGFMVLMLLPVSNLITTTGIVLAERTLYLPSMGVVLGLAAAGVSVARSHRMVRYAAAAALALVLGAGAWSSAQRQTVWHDNDRLFRQTLVDAPENYRALWLWSRHLRTLGRENEAMQALEHAVELYPNDPVVFEDLGQLQRAAGQCHVAQATLERALAIDPARNIARGRLVYCLIELEELDDARRVATTGVALGDSSFVAPLMRIDSLLGLR